MEPATDIDADGHYQPYAGVTVVGFDSGESQIFVDSDSGESQIFVDSDSGESQIPGSTEMQQFTAE